MTVAGPADFGRVEKDGTVFVRTQAGERAVGQVPGVPPEEALAFFTSRFAPLELEVSLLETRVSSGALSPDDATSSIKIVRATVQEAHAVGDLDQLCARLDALTAVVAERRAARRLERARVNAEAKAAKERSVAEAERLAASNDWHGGVNRFRDLLVEWKALPRLDRATDDELWHRFSAARTTYTRRRKAQFAKEAERREVSQRAKEKLISEAEALQSSTDWTATTNAYRDLMSRWKAAGSAPRAVDDQLWQRFRAAQDVFFNAKKAAMAEQDDEFRANGAAKSQLADEAEALLPIRDLTSARSAYRDIADRWAAIGKVPRDQIRPLDNRLRAVEQAIKQAEDDQWRRTNPEARARAEETAAKLEAQIAQLTEKAEKAEARGDGKAAREARTAAETYGQWLEQARKAADDFS